MILVSLTQNNRKISIINCEVNTKLDGINPHLDDNAINQSILTTVGLLLTLMKVN